MKEKFQKNSQKMLWREGFNFFNFNAEKMFLYFYPWRWRLTIKFNWIHEEPRLSNAHLYIWKRDELEHSTVTYLNQPSFIHALTMQIVFITIYILHHYVYIHIEIHISNIYMCIYAFVHICMNCCFLVGKFVEEPPTVGLNVKM